MITFQFRLHLPLVFLVFLQQNRTDNFDKDLSVLRLKKRCPSCWKTKWRSFSSLDVTGLASAFDNRYLEFVLLCGFIDRVSSDISVLIAVKEKYERIHVFLETS